VKVDFHFQERFVQDAHGPMLHAPLPPRYVIRLEAETEKDRDVLMFNFGPFVTNPPVIHLEFSAAEIIKYDEPQPCRTAEELKFKPTWTRPGR
jgi:hypothetical protein